MRLLSITVRNYRVHGDATVILDPSRTVIGGPNEIGKSTLAEAAHRALFLKAKTGGELQKGMLPHFPKGKPEVELRFEAGRNTYTLKKRFSGTNGTASLSQDGGKVWQDEEAEQKLGELLGVELAGGRGAAKDLARQWAHIWIEQGRAGENPALHASAHRESLLARIQQNGGSAAMESARDSAVASYFATLESSIFAKGKDKALKDSELGRAQEARDQSAAERERAAETFTVLEQAMKDFAEAQQRIATREQDLAKLREERAQIESRKTQILTLNHQATLQQRELDQATREHEALQTAHAEIQQRRLAVAELTRDLEPRRHQTTELEATESSRRDQSAQAESAWKNADALLATHRAEDALLHAWSTLFEREATHADLQRQADEVAERLAAAAALEAQLARLPEIDARRLESLRALTHEVSRSHTALQAMAAGIEVLSADVEVRAGSEPLRTGDKRVIASDTTLEIGFGTCLRITPGGGTSLAEARTAVENAARKLQNALAEVALSSFDEASQVFANRSRLSDELRAIRAEIKGRDGETLPARLEDAARQREAARAEVERRTAPVKDFTPPASLSEARSREAEARERLDLLEKRDREARSERDAALRALQQAEHALREHRASLQSAVDALAERQQELKALELRHGDEPARTSELSARAEAVTAAQAALKTTSDQLAPLQPDSIDVDLARLDRSLKQASDDIAEQGNRRAVARSRLSRDGSTDPEAALALAREAAEAAQRRYQRVEQQARAIRLLATLFAEEQRQLAHEFTRPLAEKITGYLQQLFGPNARAEVELSPGNEIESLRLIRDGRSDAFDTLSGGAREQVAAAFRLAIAEILAANHDGCLPVVFDDAFVNTDPERIQTLQRMLDLAAHRGLQVILLTCDPSNYTALGATEVLLPLPAA